MMSMKYREYLVCDVKYGRCRHQKYRLHELEIFLSLYRTNFEQVDKLEEVGHINERRPNLNLIF